METLTIIIYVLLIVLIIVAIAIGIKIIGTLNKVDVLLEDVTKKVKTLDRVFEIVDTVNSKMAMLGDSVVGFFSGVVRRIFKNKKDIIEEEEE